MSLFSAFTGSSTPTDQTASDSSTPPASTASLGKRSTAFKKPATPSGSTERASLREQKKSSNDARNSCRQALRAASDKCNEAISKTDQYINNDDKADQEDASDTLRKASQRSTNADANVDMDNESGRVNSSASGSTYSAAMGGYRRKTRGRKGKKSRASRRR
jgi:hypothetical protein